MTQEFHLSVTPVGNDVFLVRTERVAPGVPLAEEQVIWPVEDWLTQARQLMNDPLIGLLQGDRSNPFDLGLTGARLAGTLSDPDLTQPPLSLVELGQQLYGSLFQRTLRDSWVTAQGIAQNRNEALRLRLGLKGTRLPRLPWEVLYDNDTPIDQPRSSGVAPAPRPVATGTHVIFSRFRPGTRLAAASLAPINEINQPLRVLMVIAAPDDRERLELEREAHQLQQELRTPTGRVSDRLAGSPPDIQLTILNQPGREQLTEALEQGCYRVLHYAGHSDLGAAGGSLYLVNHQTGLTEILSGDDLAGLLVNNGIRLAVFNSCRGAYTAASDPSIENERNLAEALVGRGIPAVLAMAEQIPDNVALTLTWLFYRNLKQGYPIDLSLSRARQGLISAYGSHQLYWALPILYLHPEFDGYLTVADRSDENPADRLILLPQGYSGLPVLAPQEVATPLSPLSSTNLPTDEESLTDAMQADEPVDLEFDSQEADLDETYEEDAQLVADLLRQLTPPDIDEAQILDPAESAVPFDQSSSRAATGVGRSPTRPSRSATQVSGSSGAIVPTQVDTGTGQRVHPRRRLSTLVGVVGAVTLAMAGIWVWTQLDQGIVLHLPGNNTLSLGGSKDLQTADLEEVKRIAINHFEQGRFAEGEQAVAVLLDRNALKEAAEALQTVPATIDTAGVNYLWGRLAWQGLKTGNSIYKLEDAREYWEQAVEADPNNPQYQEALGFAYYAENRPNLAVTSWMTAVSLLESQAPIAEAGTPETQNAVATRPSGMSPQLLNNYAGIALGLWKSAKGQPYAEREELSHRAAKIYQKVTRDDPNGFKPEVLSRNWLWHRSTVQDWQALSQIQ